MATRDSSSWIHTSEDTYFREAEMLSGSAVTYQQEGSDSDLCKWYHTKTLNLLKLWATFTNANSTEIWVQSFPVQVMSCTGQRASVGYLNLLSSKSAGNVSSFAPDTCTSGTGGPLMADFRSAHASRGQSAVCEATRAGRGWAGQAKAEIGVSAAPSCHSLKAEIAHRKCTNSSLSISVQIDATVLHTSAALVSGRKRCEK